MRLCLFMLCFTWVTPLSAYPIVVGDQPIEIPNPPGFVPLVQGMTVYGFQQKLIVPTNQQFISFITEEDAEEASHEGMPEMNRSFSVQTSRGHVRMTMTRADFTGIKNMLKSDLASLMQKVEKEIPGMMEKLNASLNGTPGMDLDLSVSQIIPLASHEDTDRTLAYSAFVSYNLGDHGDYESFTVATTTTLVHIRGKVLFLYAYGDEEDLKWTQEVSKQWSLAIVEANPPNMATLAKEWLPEGIAGTVLMGLLVAVIKHMRK